MQVNFKEVFKQLQKERGIAPEVLKEALEAALLSAYKKTGAPAPNARVSLHLDTGEWQVVDSRRVVESVEDLPEEEDPNTVISLAEAKEVDPEIEVGQTLERDVTPADFGRLAAQMAKQVITQRLR
ncbi:MAG: NusA N-terminal domain-containing protein, partial [Bacteroidota bacterium]